MSLMDDETTGRYRDGETITSAHPVKFEFPKKLTTFVFFTTFSKKYNVGLGDGESSRLCYIIAFCFESTYM